MLFYAPALRGLLAPVRTQLKYLHIGSGLLSLALLLAYVPLLPEHWRRLGARIGQKVNVVILTFLLLAWGGTGLVLTFHRSHA